MGDQLRILIVDDSALYRRILTMAVEGMPLAVEVETAPGGAIALKKIPDFQPDILLVDIEMPDMSGIEVLKKVKKDFPQITVVLVSGVNSRSADITIEGLTSGAADFISKPAGNDFDENTNKLRDGLQQIFGMIRERKAARAERVARRAEAASRPAPAPKPAAPRLPSLIPGRIGLVAVGISTGGPNALEKMIPMLPREFRVPIVIVQHMPPLFTNSLARSLDRHASVPVFEAANGQQLEKGCVYLAPGGIHMVVKSAGEGEQRKLVVGFDDGPPENSCKPAVDVLFRSLAQIMGANTLAVIMTGMGQDGMEGVKAIKARMGYCLTQNEETCVVYGMPQAVDAAGLSDESLALDDLAPRIVSLVEGARA